MDEPVPSFGQQLLTYRRRLYLSQQEVAKMVGIYASDLSKIERGEKKPPRAEIVLRLIEALQLSHTERRAFVIAAGFSEAILKRAKYDPSKYPPVAQEVVKEKLHGSYGHWPVLELDTDRKILSANLLAFRLWGALGEATQELMPDLLLGENVYTVLVRPENLSRISMPAKKSDFWYTFLAIWNKLKERTPQSTVTAFEAVIETHPVLRLILRYGSVNIERDWVYDLDILPPVISPVSDEPEMYLKFQIEVERIMKGEKYKGFLVSYHPVKSFTQDWVEREYTRLIATYGEEAFVQREPDTHLIEEKEKYPSFFPAVHHNAVWTINFENRAFILLFDNGEEFRNKHYFEMLLSPRIIALMGGFAKEKLLLPVRQFLHQTKDRENDPHYAAIKTRLLRLPAFQTLLTDLWQTSPEAHAQPAQGMPCFSIAVVCPYTDTVQLSFAIVARRPYANEADYRITFVPTTNVTKVVLILLRLQNDGDVLSLIGATEYEQLLWFLVVLKTVKEGLPKQKGQADWGWHPEGAFKKLHSTLTIETEQSAISPSEVVKLHITWTLTQLSIDRESSQEALVAILNGFVGKLKEQDPTTYQFLPQDLSPASENAFRTQES